MKSTTMAFSSKALVATLLLATLIFNILEAAPSADYTVERPEAICRMTKAVGICKAHIIRWRYNAETRKCEEFVYGGCRGNGNNFEEEEDCLAVCKGV